MCLRFVFGSAVVVAAPWTDAGIGTYLHVDVAAVTTMSSAEVANPSDFFKQHAGVGASPHSDKSEGTDWLVVRQRMMNNALHEFLVQHGWRKEEAPRFGAGRDQAIVFARERRRQATGASNLETGMDCLFRFEFECATTELTYFLVKHSVSAAKVMHRTVGITRLQHGSQLLLLPAQVHASRQQRTTAELGLVWAQLLAGDRGEALSRMVAALEVVGAAVPHEWLCSCHR